MFGQFIQSVEKWQKFWNVASYSGTRPSGHMDESVRKLLCPPLPIDLYLIGCYHWFLWLVLFFSPFISISFFHFCCTESISSYLSISARKANNDSEAVNSTSSPGASAPTNSNTATDTLPTDSLTQEITDPRSDGTNTADGPTSSPTDGTAYPPSDYDYNDYDYYDYGYWVYDYDYYFGGLEETKEEEYEIEEAIRAELALKNDSMIVEMGHQFEDLVFECSFRGYDCRLMHQYIISKC